MTQIILTAEQSAVLAGAADPVVVLDPAGNRLGQISREKEIVFSPARIAEARQRLRTETGGASTAEVLEKLRKLGGTPCDTP
jgi:hypothetical protein